jgi:hypothetical protein
LLSLEIKNCIFQACYPWKLKTSYFSLIAMEIKSFSFKLKCTEELDILAHLSRKPSYFSSSIRKSSYSSPWVIFDDINM